MIGNIASFRPPDQRDDVPGSQLFYCYKRNSIKRRGKNVGTLSIFNKYRAAGKEYTKMFIDELTSSISHPSNLEGCEEEGRGDVTGDWVLTFPNLRLERSTEIVYTKVSAFGFQVRWGKYGEPRVRGWLPWRRYRGVKITFF